MQRRSLEVIVGVFIIAAIAALIILAFKVSGLTEFGESNFYYVSAEFDNIGGLKVRAPVAIAGVSIGQVVKISLDQNTFRAKVTLKINKKINNVPVDSSASILTQGILGSNYVSITPGFEEKNLANGGSIETTHSALVLENLIGQLIYSVKGDKGNDSSSTATDNNKDSDKKE